MKKWGTQLLIHGFALAHAVTVALCARAGLPDTLFLTVLTMAMAIVICYREQLTVQVTIVSLVLVNVLGFVLGNLGAQVVFEDYPPIWQHVFSTFIVTELLGWSLFLFAHRFKPVGATHYERRKSWIHDKWWLVGIVAAILGLRVYIGINYQGNLFQDSAALGIMTIITVIFLGYMVYFAVSMQREASSQRTRRHQAEFSYMNLKNQVNPHFLFNSLNVLDSIVQEGTREEASAYIHKMAAIYRYMMQHDGQRLVTIQEEFDFSCNYRDLIQIRFPEGLIIESQLRSHVPDGYIVPCTLQLLLENAIKHNAIGPERPLTITLSTDGKNLSVRNNCIPKQSLSGSTGIGLQYIRNQYRDLANKEIIVTQTPEYFEVTIPILENNLI